MKNIIPVLGLCMFLCGCGEDAPPSKSNSYTPPVFKKNETAVAAPVQPAATQPATSQATASKTVQPATTAAVPAKDTKTPLQRPATQVLNDAAAVVDYGTGATPLTAKKKMTDKIQAIQTQQNQNTQKSLGK
jgi:hypothetical protein